MDSLDSSRFLRLPILIHRHAEHVSLLKYVNFCRWGVLMILASDGLHQGSRHEGDFIIIVMLLFVLVILNLVAGACLVSTTRVSSKHARLGLSLI